MYIQERIEGNGGGLTSSRLSAVSGSKLAGAAAIVGDRGKLRLRYFWLLKSKDFASVVCVYVRRSYLRVIVGVEGFAVELFEFRARRCKFMTSRVFFGKRLVTRID